MPQSLSKIMVHFIFSTKDRMPLIDRTIELKLHAYIATICRSNASNAYRVGGVSDHIHIACDLPRTVAPSKLIEVIKKDSSKWMKSQGAAYKKFYWQNGYGAFSIGFSQLASLIDYIDNQAEHHRKHSFQEEYLQFLSRYRVEFNERYVWD